ncbi:hypothetical protein SSS_07023 [Sarcoptes scabiei]|uniref:Uncharacterized protein n=1 Tax=Sarcoptes scabiei TaxID=52283 RepID=A0A834R6E5_SARSC|nr:hypothetical protein SSS_07023 [Sarcoptes scabiei]
MESEIETNSYEPNQIRKEFEKRAKEELNGKNLLPSKTTRLIEKFEKKAQGIEEKRSGLSNPNSKINNIRKVFEPNGGGGGGDELDDETPEKIIPSGSTNKLIGIFQTESSNNSSTMPSSSSSSTSSTTTATATTTRPTMKMLFGIDDDGDDDGDDLSPELYIKERKLNQTNLSLV